MKKKLINKNKLIKILGDGELKKVLTVEAQAFSKQAQKKIESAKGKAIVVKVIQKKETKKEKTPKKSLVSKPKQKKVISKKPQNKKMKVSKTVAKKNKSS